MSRVPAAYVHHGQSRGSRIQGPPHLTDTAVCLVYTFGLSVWVCGWGEITDSQKLCLRDNRVFSWTVLA